MKDYFVIKGKNGKLVSIGPIKTILLVMRSAGSFIVETKTGTYICDKIYFHRSFDGALKNFNDICKEQDNGSL